MIKVIQSKTLSTGLAVFAMLFGAGNLIYPLQAGLMCVHHFYLSFLGFYLASVILPLIGFITIILFDGDYRAFFYRVGKIPGNLLIFMCMLAIGPVIAMPRIINVAYMTLTPYLPFQSLALFSALFLGFTFIGAFKEKRIIDLLGYYIAPLLLVTLGITIMQGLLVPSSPLPNLCPPTSSIFFTNLKFGLGILDLLGAIFLGAIVVSILKQNLKREAYIRVHTLALMAFYASLVGCFLLGLIYIGLGALGYLHGSDFVSVNPGVLFSNIVLKIYGINGPLMLSLILLLACFSTAIALAAIVSEYVQRDITNNGTRYIPTLISVLVTTFIFSLLGLDRILDLSLLTIEAIGLPIVITITFANLAYKLFNFKPIKIPVAIVAFITTFMFIFNLFNTL